jgi:hypothetical protein
MNYQRIRNVDLVDITSLSHALAEWRATLILLCKLNTKQYVELCDRHSQEIVDYENSIFRL